LARRVRAATVPLFVVFGAARCAASRALLAYPVPRSYWRAAHALMLRVDVDRSPLLAEQYGVTATPTVLVLQHGEELTRMIGFAPAALVRLLIEQSIAGELTPGRLWRPVEQVFEDAVIIPLLDAWGWRYCRQVICPRRAGKALTRGRADIVVYADDASTPLTLFENKRHIASSSALRQAVAQARIYAEALQVGTFVVAAPAGMWVYRLDGGQPRQAYAFTSLEIASAPDALRQVLRWL